jgi:dihydrofolate reductase
VQLSLVVAMSRSGLIGREGAIPWRLPRDLRHFRKLTWGKPIIMGRKTHESLGRALPGRTNIVLTHKPDYHAEGCLIAHGADLALALAKETGGAEAMIIGGAQVYRDFLPRCNAIHLTLVEGSFVGDTYFPTEIQNSTEWIEVRKEHWPADAENPMDATYALLERLRGATAPTFPALPRGKGFLLIDYLKSPRETT